MKNTLISLMILTISFLQSYSQPAETADKDFIIYSVKEGKIVDAKTVINDLANYDVLFYGEEHTDDITHNVQTLLLGMIYEKYGKNTALSMEMFDRDAQYIINEYLNGWIKESNFTKDARAWPNYKQYRPLVEFVKTYHLQLVAANAPFRYVSLVNKFGTDTLLKLSKSSQEAKNAMAPLPHTLASGDYAEKLRNLGKDDPDKKKKKKPEMPENKLDIIPGHSLWDATMAYSVYQYHKAHPGSKILHLNGCFHTEEHYGICQRLAELDPDIKALVITSRAMGKDFKKINFDEYKKLGDYIVFTKTKPE